MEVILKDSFFSDCHTLYNQKAYLSVTYLWGEILLPLRVDATSLYIPKPNWRLFLFIIFTYLFYLKERRRNGKRLSIHLFTPQMAAKARARPGWNHSIWVSHVAVPVSHTLRHALLLSQCVSRKRDWRWNSWNLKPCCYVMPPVLHHTTGPSQLVQQWGFKCLLWTRPKGYQGYLQISCY